MSDTKCYTIYLTGFSVCEILKKWRWNEVWAESKMMLWGKIKETLHFDIVNHKYVPHTCIYSHTCHSTRSRKHSPIWTVFHLDFVFSIFAVFFFQFSLSIATFYLHEFYRKYTLLTHTRTHTEDLLLFRKMCIR